MRKTWPAPSPPPPPPGPVSAAAAAAVAHDATRPLPAGRPTPTALRSGWSVSSRGISSMKRERTPNDSAPNTLRRRA